MYVLNNSPYDDKAWYMIWKLKSNDNETCEAILSLQVFAKFPSSKKKKKKKKKNTLYSFCKPYRILKQLTFTWLQLKQMAK